MNVVFPQTQSAETTDRLGFSVVLALAVHALVIFGVGFQLRPEARSAPALEITLARHSSREAPEEADYLAQFDQQGSGSERESRQITTDRIAPLESSELRDTQPLAPPPSSRQRATSARTVVSTHSQDAPAIRDPTDAREGLAPDSPDTPQVNQEIAALRARLDQQRQEYSKMPRVLRLTTASTKAAEEAEYLRQWVEWVEEIGNRHYPPEARAQKIFGDLSLAVTLTRDGAIASVEILRSSGYRVLDLAAVRIVRRAAPFAPIPRNIEEDQVEIIRTWRFIPGNQFATEAH